MGSHPEQAKFNTHFITIIYYIQRTPSHMSVLRRTATVFTRYSTALLTPFFLNQLKRQFHLSQCGLLVVLRGIICSMVDYFFSLSPYLTGNTVLSRL